MLYRVRGPYATALAKMVLDAGHELVDLSKKLAERISMPQRTEVLPQATIKESDEDPDAIIIVGYKDAVETMLIEIVTRVPFTNYRFEELGPYTTIAAKLKGFEKGQCMAEVMGSRIVIQDVSTCNEGEVTIVHIVKPALKQDDKAVALPGAAILKDTLVLLDDGEGRIYFSEHIRDYDRKATLTTISNQYTRQGFSIRWRSTARSAPLEKIIHEIDEAANEVKKLRGTRPAEPTILYQGEAIAYIKLSRPSKEYLDDIRRSIIPTTPYHHQLRTCGVCEEAIDLLDTLSIYIDSKIIVKAIENQTVRSMINKNVILEHNRPGEKVVEIGPMTVLDLMETEFGTMILGKRRMQKNGVYDGLDIERKSGDLVYTFIPLNNWFIVHQYTDGKGGEKGVYININTPPEICYNKSVIKYIDLFVDVVVVGNSIKVIDINELDKAYQKGLIDVDSVYMVEELTKKIVNSIDVIRKVLGSASLR
ncbi:MAG: DUF402 domain-containing protein [Ignisphaera sp.]|nr:DUF402 domain-containing protein [Ignisphaera sp.]